MDPAANSTNFHFKPNGQVEVPAAGTLLAGDATVSLPSSQTSKHSSSIFHSHSASRPDRIPLEAKPGGSLVISISLSEPDAANSKSATSVTKQMTETSERLSKGRALCMEDGSSLKVTQRSTRTACAAVSTFSGDQPGSLAGPPHQTGSEATTKDELKMGKFTSAVESVQSPAQNPQMKLTSAQNPLRTSIISGTPISASGVLPQINNGIKSSAQNGAHGSTIGTVGGAPSTTEPQINTDSNYNTPGLNGIITYTDTEQDPSLQQIGDSILLGMNNMSGAPQLFEAEMFNPTLYSDLPKPTPNLDPDNCFKCKNPGDFINCSSCEKPYHLFCADLDRMPERIWECYECQSISRERLIRNLKEKQRQKAREREVKKEKDRLERENAKKQREDEQKCRREQKEQRKMAIKMQRLEQQERKTADQIAATEQRVNQLVIGPDGKPVIASVLKQTTLKTEKRKRNKPEHVLTPAELQRLERSRLIKHQFQIFGELYPEYVERNTVRYPIPDALIEKMPELHGGLMKPKPKLMKIDISAENFERILYIWEFCNNFSEFLDTPQFKLEELEACLNYDAAKDPRMEMTIVQVEELDWTEQMQLKHIREKGFHMVNLIHTALAEKYLQDLFPEDQASGTSHAISSSGETQNQILASINKLIEDKQMLWPEIVRLILIYAKNEDPNVFGPFEEQVTQICAKLAGGRPHTYNNQLTYQEKVTLLTVLVDCIHQTNEFRLFLNKRNDDKSTYNREKMELYQKIREIETAKEEFIKQYAQNQGNKTQEQIQQELAELYAKLSAASRTESKPVKDQIVDLERQQSNYTRQLAIFDEKSKKYSATIARLNEKAFKGSIKTTMLGKDSAKNEYWHFKDDCSRIFIRTEEEVPIQGDVQMTVEHNSPSEELAIQKQSTQIDSGALHRSEQRSLAEAQTALIETGHNVVQQHLPVGEEDHKMAVSTQTRYSWYYYEREDQFEGLFDSLNPKGQRERKLQENLKKIKDRLKLKKPLKVAPQKVQEGQQLPEEVSAINEERKLQSPSNLQETGVEGTEGIAKPQRNVSREGNSAEGSLKQVEMKDADAEDQESVTEDEIDTEPVQEPSLKQVMEEEESADLATRRVMFATDNWEDAITEAVWFGQKIPQKRRFNYRGGGNQKDPVDIFFEDNVSLQNCKAYLISIGETYMVASSQHDREWEEDKVRETWAENINKASKVSEFLPLITQLDDGMSLPTSLCSRQGQNGEPPRIQRLKLQLFKFWPSQDMKQAWKSYLQQDGSLNQNNVNALFIALKILDTACQQFSVRQAEKMERKNKQAIKQAVQPNQINFPAKQMGSLPDAQSRWQRAAVRQTIKYFESSEEEEDEDDAESGEKKDVEESQNYKSRSDVDQSDISDEDSKNFSPRQPSKATQRKAARSNNKKAVAVTAKKAAPVKQATSGPKPRRGRGRRLEDSEMVSEEESDDEQSRLVEDEKVNTDQADDDEDDDQQSWDEYCYVCQDGGNVMCCEDCSQVAHYGCAGFKSAPKGDWWCKDCSAKKLAMAQKKQMSTRVNNGSSNSRMQNTQGKKISSASSTRQATLTSMMPTRSSRRNGK